MYIRFGYYTHVPLVNSTTDRIIVARVVKKHKKRLFSAFYEVHYALTISNSQT